MLPAVVSLQEKGKGKGYFPSGTYAVDVPWNSKRNQELTVPEAIEIMIMAFKVKR